MEFKDLPQTKKGSLGEQELDKYLLSKGIIPYMPIANAAHPFDRLCATADKKRLYVAECKTKASRSAYPDTGINKRSFDEYVYIREKYGIDVWLFFIDEFRMEIYGNLLSELEKPHKINYNNKVIEYPWIQESWNKTKIIYFPLEKMIKVSDISAEAAEQMKLLSNRSYGYPKYKVKLSSDDYSRT